MSSKRMYRITGKPTLGKGKLTVTLYFEPKSLRMTETPFGVILDLYEAYTIGEPGIPGFPMKLIRLALPAFSDVTNLKTTTVKKEKVTTKPVFIAPIQEPQPGFPQKRGGKDVIKRSLYDTRRKDIEKPNYTKKAKGVTLPNLQKYQSILAKPAPLVRVAGIEHRGGTTILSMEVNPVNQTKTGLIELTTEVRIEIEYESTSVPKKGGLIVGSRSFKPARTKLEAKQFAEIYKGEVLNPDWVFDTGDFAPWPFAQYDYLIITDNNRWDALTIASTTAVGDMVSSFQKLITWKKKRGLSARIVTITNIVNGVHGDFKTGARDLQEVIRNFIKWAYSHWSISWMLLGGDVEILPIRVAETGCRGLIYKDSVNPPDDNTSFWTGVFLEMHVVNPGEWWPGAWPLILVNPATGAIIPFDPTGTSSSTNPGWYYTTNNSYTTRSTVITQFVRVNGPAALINTTLQWLYEWNRVPTDLYYSSLAGPNYNLTGLHDWDLTNNNIYGQNTDSIDMDGVSYSADIGVGRAPVSTVAEADAFVNKVISYEQFRRPDGTELDVNWPRRLAMVSSNWGGRIWISSTSSNPPSDNRYHHTTTDPYTMIKLGETFPDLLWRLFVVVTQTDIRIIPYDYDAANSGRGWYFAKSGTDLSVSELVISLFGIVFRIPIRSQWIVVYGYSDELAPQNYIFDRTEADGSMADQEILRKQIAADFPGIDTVRRLYEDEVDLPIADATSPPVDHLTANKLKDVLNLGQHFVSLSGHGSQGGCCALDRPTAQGLTNGYHTFIAWADSCLTNDFTSVDSMSEDLVKNVNGGAVGYIGNTRFSWIGLGDDYQREFFKRLKSVRNLALLNDSRFNLPNNWVYYKWIKYALNLLGDPEMPLWVGKVKTMKVTHPVKIQKKHQIVQVKVTSSSGNPIQGAVVCFVKDNWVASAITEVLGVANLHMTPPSLGNMEVIVTAIDFKPYFGTILVEKAVACNTAIICPGITCGPAISCGTKILCGSSIICNSSILCGAEIVPCGGKISCNLSISGCWAGIGAGCPAIDPVPWEDIFDILKECDVKDIKELVAKQNTPQVKKVIAKLSPANQKALLLMLKKIGKE